MKILIIVPNMKPGGAEKILRDIANTYCKKDDQVTLFFLSSSPGSFWNSIINKNLFIIKGRFQSPKLSLLSLLKLLILKGNCYNIIISSHSFISFVVGFVSLLGYLSNSRLIFRESTSVFLRFGKLKKEIYRFFYEKFYQKAFLIICQTDLMKKQLISNVDFSDNQNIKVFPNPIDYLEAINNSKGEDLSNYGDFIVAAGRLIPEKGFDILLRAFYRLNKEFPLINLIILGDGPDRAKLLSIISELGLEKSVKLLGNVENVYPYFRSAKLCVISSRIEGFPNVLLEMMAVNKNVISTRCAGGIEELEGVLCVDTNEYEIFVGIKSRLFLDHEQLKGFNEILIERDISNYVKRFDENFTTT